MFLNKTEKILLALFAIVLRAIGAIIIGIGVSPQIL
jgi:hypothetical protein